MNDKPLKDWTLGEVKAHCKTTIGCVGCQFRGISNVGCALNSGIPSCWGLTDKPRFTSEEIENAKAIMRLMPSYDMVMRDLYGIRLTNASRQLAFPLLDDAFPSVAEGEKVMLVEIARYKNEAT
jgi:hypothetical protein